MSKTRRVLARHGDIIARIHNLPIELFGKRHRNVAPGTSVVDHGP